jgi:hypothetical protein
METLLDILTGTHIGGIFALLQTILFVLSFVIGSEYKEMSADLWEIAVEIWDNEDVRATFQDYINDIIIDAEINLHDRNRAEEAVDSYLNDLAEAELSEANL